MSEQQDWIQQLGFKLPSLAAGFFGGIVSLTYEKSVTFSRALLMIVTGAVCAGYLPPILNKWLNFGDSLENGLAFIVGLLSMKLVGGLMKLGERFEKNPLKTIKNLKDDKDSDSDDDSE